MPDGASKRDDNNFSYVAAWEFRGNDEKPDLHKEPLIFENVQPSLRSYK
jgi:succinate dehydrogenase / fumarate reductase flavoprotein subunit